jgi:hypothetical protein
MHITATAKRYTSSQRQRLLDRRWAEEALGAESAHYAGAARPHLGSHDGFWQGLVRWEALDRAGNPAWEQGSVA